MKTIQITIHNPEGKSTHSIITPLSHIYRKQNSFYLRSVSFFSSLLFFYLIPCFVTSHEIFLLTTISAVYSMFYLIATIIVTMRFPWFFYLLLQPLFTFVSFRLHTSFFFLYPSTNRWRFIARVPLLNCRLMVYSFIRLFCSCAPLSSSLYLSSQLFVCPYLISIYFFFLCYCFRSNCCVACRYRFAGCFLLLFCFSF